MHGRIPPITAPITTSSITTLSDAMALTPLSSASSAVPSRALLAPRLSGMLAPGLPLGGLKPRLCLRDAALAVEVLAALRGAGGASQGTHVTWDDNALRCAAAGGAGLRAAALACIGCTLEAGAMSTVHMQLGQEAGSPGVLRNCQDGQA